MMPEQRESSASSTSKPPATRTALAAGILAAALCILTVIALLGTRWSFWSYSTGLSMVRSIVYGGLITMALAGFAMYRTRPGLGKRGFPLAALALFTGLVLVMVPFREWRSGANTPPIHDVTTDTENPPPFLAVAPLREGATNPVEHGGPEVSRLQAAAYPDIRPLILDVPIDRAYRRALDVAQASDWTIVEANQAEGRIEATDRTFWFGLQEDVVIRLTPLNGRTVVDIRSSSRYPANDRGSNARRVREYLQAIDS